MKSKIVALVIVTGTLFIASCGKKGPSEEMKNSMKTFEADWKATGDQMTAWGQTLDQKTTEMNNMMKESMPMDEHMDMKGGKMDSKMDMKGMSSMDSMDQECMMISNSLNDMKTTYTTAMTNWAADTKAYEDWKANAMKGDMKDEDMKKEMDSYSAKLTAYKTDMQNWNTMLMDLEKKCSDACMMMKGDMKGDMKGM